MSKIDKKSIIVILILAMLFAIVSPTQVKALINVNPDLETMGVTTMVLGNRALLSDGTLWKIESAENACLEDTGVKAYNFVYNHYGTYKCDYYAKLKKDNTLNVKVTEVNDETKVKSEKTIPNVKKIIEQYDGSFLAYLTYDNKMYFLNPYEAEGEILFNNTATDVEKVIGQYYIKDGKTYLADGTKIIDKVITSAYKDYCAVGSNLYEAFYIGSYADPYVNDSYATNFKEFVNTKNINGWMVYKTTDGNIKNTGNYSSSQSFYNYHAVDGSMNCYLTIDNNVFMNKKSTMFTYLKNVVDMNMINNSIMVFTRSDGTIWANKSWDSTSCTKIISPSLNKVTDLNTNSWYYNSVKYVFNNGIMTGLNETTFAPSNNLNRGMMVTLLYRMDGTPEVTGAPTFPDVQDSNKYYYKAVKWAADNGIVSGYANGKFGPTDNITRAQLAVILYNYAEYKDKDVSKRADLSEFPDNNQVASWAQNAVKWAIAEGIISGNVNKQTGVKTIDPRQNATRAQVASMMERYCKNVGR